MHIEASSAQMATAFQAAVEDCDEAHLVAPSRQSGALNLVI